MSLLSKHQLGSILGRVLNCEIGKYLGHRKHLMHGIDPRMGYISTGVQVNDIKPAHGGQFMGASQPARPAVDPINIGPGLLQSLQSLTQTHQQPQQQVQPSSAYILVHEMWIPAFMTWRGSCYPSDVFE